MFSRAIESGFLELAEIFRLEEACMNTNTAQPLLTGSMTMSLRRQRNQRGRDVGRGDIIMPTALMKV